MPELHVVVEVTVHAEKLSEFLALISHHAHCSRRESGCLRFEVLRQVMLSCCFLIHEIWAGVGEIDKHRQTEHYQRWRREILDIQDGSRTHKEFYSVEPLSTPLSEILSVEQLLHAVQQARLSGKRVAFTNGCFDVLHPGHIRLLQEARKQADLLVVGLNSDTSVRAIKGSHRPVNSVDARATVLTALDAVDYLTVFEEKTPLSLIELLQPDVLVKGGDYRKSQVVGTEFVESYGGRVHLVPLQGGYSTTAILQRASCLPLASQSSIG